MTYCFRTALARGEYQKSASKLLWDTDGSQAFDSFSILNWSSKHFDALAINWDSSITHKSASSKVFLFPTSIKALTQPKVKYVYRLLLFDKGSGTRALLLMKGVSTSLLSQEAVARKPVFFEACMDVCGSGKPWATFAKQFTDAKRTVRMAQTSRSSTWNRMIAPTAARCWALVIYSSLAARCIGGDDGEWLQKDAERMGRLKYSLCYRWLGTVYAEEWVRMYILTFCVLFCFVVRSSRYAVRSIATYGNDRVFACVRACAHRRPRQVDKCK